MMTSSEMGSPNGRETAPDGGAASPRSGLSLRTSGRAAAGAHAVGARRCGEHDLGHMRRMVDPRFGKRPANVGPGRGATVKRSCLPCRRLTTCRRCRPASSVRNPDAPAQEASVRASSALVGVAGSRRSRRCVIPSTLRAGCRRRASRAFLDTHYGSPVRSRASWRSARHSEDRANGHRRFGERQSNDETPPLIREGLGRGTVALALGGKSNHQVGTSALRVS